MFLLKTKNVFQFHKAIVNFVVSREKRIRTKLCTISKFMESQLELILVLISSLKSSVLSDQYF